MNLAAIVLLVVSVVLSTTAQLLLKVGMSAIRAAGPGQGGPLDFAKDAAVSPWVIGGLIAYGASAVVWLGVLSKVDVSRAYPCVALGFALTVLAAHIFLGEPVSMARMVGVGVISLGVVLVAVW
jgi:multidrug transporter EmrE-like cation transporter